VVDAGIELPIMIDSPNATSSAPFRITPQLVVGVVVILVGITFTLDQLGVTSAVNYLRYWPMALIAIGVLKLLQAREGGGAFAGLLFAVVGVWLQGEELNLIHIRLRDVWPLGLVAFGAYLVYQGLATRQHGPSQAMPLPPSNPPFDAPSHPASLPSLPSLPGLPGRGVTDTNATMSAMAILGGVSRGNNSSAFRGADLLAIMGGLEIDLRKAAINGEAVVDVFAMWGGIELRVPEDWTVVSRVVPLMGGVDDKTRPPQGATTHRLVLRGFAIMGGIEIKN
jgi:hypothetical protein